MFARSNQKGQKGSKIRELNSLKKEESRQIGSKQYIEQDVVWAKIEGYPWWPSIVKSKSYPKYSYEQDSSNWKKSIKYTVQFLGDQTHAEIDQSKLVDYLTNRDILIGQAKNYRRMFDKQSFENAIKEADFLTDNPYASSSQEIEKQPAHVQKRTTILQKEQNKVEEEPITVPSEKNELSLLIKEGENKIQKQFTKEQMSSQLFRNSAKHLLMELKRKNIKGRILPLDLKKLALKMLKRDLRIQRATRHFIGHRIQFDNWGTIKNLSLQEILKVYNFKPQGKTKLQGIDQTSRDTIHSQFDLNQEQSSHSSVSINQKTAKTQPRFEVYVNEFGISTIDMTTLQQVEISISV